MQNENNDDDDMQLIGLKEVARLTNLSRSTIRRLMKTNSFPKPMAISQRRKAWLKAEILSWIQARRLEKTSTLPPSGVITERQKAIHELASRFRH